ncbi:hypothetical protein HZY91_05390 [Facklamia sp. DSM 111018]|uniref:DUF5082 domain-containing protein n=1 Tax=Facklamia lactis TaxID=2749967 RepID=A0ABS0LSL1_9LACT|nr:hypothetical protein [Facklamia lactis]MBG9980534.1 hypothetical protein [Facklamia lactis]MBG9986326.1 hypothetical protein [Facklamia lactis]
MSYSIENIQEAQTILITCQKEIESILSALNDIKSLSWMDILGGDFLLSWLKREKIAKVNERVEGLKALLVSARNELKDIDPYLDVVISNTTTDYFWDIGCDNLLTDVRVHEEINQNIERLSTLAGEISLIQQQIESL